MYSIFLIVCMKKIKVSIKDENTYFIKSGAVVTRPIINGPTENILTYG